MTCPNASNGTIVGFIRPTISYRTENCLFLYSSLGASLVYPRTMISYRIIQENTVSLCTRNRDGLFSLSGSRISVTQCIIYEIEKESMIFSGLPLQGKLRWGGRSICLVFYDGLFWTGMIGRKDGQANIYLVYVYESRRHRK